MSLFGMGKKSATKTILIIDTGSSSAGAAIAKLDKNGPPLLLKQTRIETPVDSGRTAEKLEERMLAAAKQAVAEVISETASPKTAPSQAGGEQGPAAPAARQTKPLIKNADAQHISHVAVFLPAPWSMLRLRTLQFSQKEPIKVSAATLERMIAEYAQKEEPAEAGQELIERSALGIRLNGYAVEDIPKNASANTLALTVVSVVASAQTLSLLRDLVRDMLGHAVTISFHSSNISLSWGFSAVFPEEDDYLLCNGEGEVTELLLVEAHVPKASATAPQGCSAVLRTLNVHADMARAEASSALVLARDENSPMQDKLAKTLTAAQKTCAESFEAAAKELLAHFGAPAKIYTLASGPEALWYADALVQAPFLKNLVPGGVPVANVPYGAISRFLSASSSLPSAGALTSSAAVSGRAGDLFLALEAIFCDSRFDEGRTFNFSLK